MSYTEIVNPSLIENTSMLKVFTDEGVHRNYRITPNPGYVLHDKGLDYVVTDEEGNETGEVILGFRTSTASVHANYDFAVNEREFYTVLANTVPEDQIFGTASKPEIM